MKRARYSGVLLMGVALSFSAAAQTILPNPVIALEKVEYFEQSGSQFVRYEYSVVNSDSYPDQLFAASPELPPCGKNTRASRSWVDIFDQRGKRLYGFCAFGKPADLNGIWFALPVGEVPPSWIYLEIKDRKSNITYKSNLAETTL